MSQLYATDLARISLQGARAWRRLKTGKSWRDWVAVGEAMVAGRNWAMNQAGTNAPIGKGYNLVFGEWLVQYKLDDTDKGDRNRLFTCMDNLGMIEEWRKTLTQTQRLALNHPNAVLRKWQKAIEPEPELIGREPKPTLRDSVVNLSEENHEKDRLIEQLNDRIAELLGEVQEKRAHISDLEHQLYLARMQNV